MSATLERGDRIVHCNHHHSYGHGRIVEKVRPLVGRASKAYVRFDGETADRLVWIDDLTPEPAGTPGSRQPFRLVDDGPLVA
jgi:hypothetical protein